MDRVQVIRVDYDLPLRARPLTAAVMTQIFGGCKDSGPCNNDSDCCPSYTCYPTSGDAAFGGKQGCTSRYAIH